MNRFNIQPAMDLLSSQNNPQSRLLVITNKYIFTIIKCLFLIGVLLFMLGSCSTTPEYLSKAELQTYITEPSNGLTKKIQTGALTMELTYRPSDFLTLQTIGTKEPILSTIQQTMAQYGSHAYFIMQLKAGEKDALYGSSAGQNNFSDNLQTLAFRMGEYIYATTSRQDTIPLADSYYDRTFGMGGSSNVLLTFNREKMQGSDWIALHIKEFGFNTGNRTIQFDYEEIENTPKLKELENYYSHLSPEPRQVERKTPKY